METPRQEEVLAELRKITAETSVGIADRYLCVRSAYLTPYDWPDFDPCRWEVSLCITFGLYQAAITLTNHFLERLLKYALAYQHSIRKQGATPQVAGGTTLEEVVGWTTEGKDLYGDRELAANINQACSTGLITKEQKKDLHTFREDFRNAYSHADPDKTFKEAKTEAHVLRLDKSGALVKESSGNAGLADLLFAHGVFQFEMAKANAVPYFLYIDALARHIICKLKPLKSSGS